MSDIDSILVNSFSNMNLSDIDKKIKNTSDIDVLDDLLNNLSLSDKVPNEYKKIIYYWVGLQIDTINKKLIEKEQLPLVNFY